MVNQGLAPRRRSPRLRGYDYRAAGAYFVTICTEGRACLFGDIVDDTMHLTGAGHVVQQVWEQIPAAYPGYDTDAFVVMPNHVHGILVRHDREASLSLPAVLQRFKALTTRRYIDGVVGNGWTRFDGRLWQRSYHHHVVRDEVDLERVRQYIVENPMKWALDAENPVRKT